MHAPAEQQVQQRDVIEFLNQSYAEALNQFT
jgi:hypothetical protein